MTFDELYEMVCSDVLGAASSTGSPYNPSNPTSGDTGSFQNTPIGLYGSAASMGTYTRKGKKKTGKMKKKK